MRVFPAFVPLACALAATGAAAQTTAAPTPAATPAPRYQAFDLGTHHRAVSTSNADAQKAFDQGLLWSFSFNHGDAERAFREAARLDDTLAMAWWIAGANIRNADPKPEMIVNQLITVTDFGVSIRGAVNLLDVGSGCVTSPVTTTSACGPSCCANAAVEVSARATALATNPRAGRSRALLRCFERDIGWLPES